MRSPIKNVLASYRQKQSASKKRHTHFAAFAMTHGFTVAFKVSAALLFTGAVVLFFFINIGKDSLVETEGVIAH